jgi:dTDP-4-amino-4,6-dideoxygalactose transaminase
MNSGTATLHSALVALGVGIGDEVITPALTVIMDTTAILHANAIPVYVDVNEKTFNIDAKLIEKAITPKTKAIVPVHLFGQCANMEAIMELAKKHNLFVIEDTAQAIGADYKYADGSTKKAGTIGTIGCTSFFPSKNLGC